MNAIVVVDSNWAIGNKGGLLMHLPEDLRHFREMTIGKTIIIGRKTLESFPGGRPLPGRTNIVLTGNREYERDDCIICHSREEVMQKISDVDEEDVFVCGGASVYRQFMDLCDTFYVTRLDRAFEADRYFEDLDRAEEIEETDSGSAGEDEGVKYRFAKYERK